MLLSHHLPSNMVTCFMALILMFSGTTKASSETTPQDLAIASWIDHAKANITTKTLANGLSIMHYKIPNTCEVFVGLSYTVGSKDEMNREHGFAHMVEHMIFKGTNKMSETDLHSITEKFGVTNYNATTSYDQTNYYFISDNKNWQVFLGILADCMQNVRFDEHHFASEVKAVINELKMRRAKPHIKLYDTLYDELYPKNHPYGHSTGGDKETLIHATAQDLKKFYQHHYSPQHATLIVVGNLDKDVVFAQAEQLFGSIPNNTQATSSHHYHPEFFTMDLMKKNLVCFLHTPNPLIAYVWHIPGSKNNQYHASLCLSHVLQERLRTLKDDHGLVFSVYARPIIETLSGFCEIVIEPKVTQKSTPDEQRVLIEQCKKIMQAELDKLMINGPTDEEIAMFKTSYTTEFLSMFEHCESVAQLLQATKHINNNPYQCFDDLAQISKLTKLDIQNFCRQYLRSIAMNTIMCHPIPEAEKATWLATQQRIDRYEQQIINAKIRDSVLEKTSLADALPEPEKLQFAFEKPDESFTLSNGLQVFIKKQTTTPFVVGLCAFKNDEPFDIFCKQTQQASTFHMTIDLLDEGCHAWEELGLPELSKQQIRDYFHRHGASYSFGGTGGSFVCLNRDFLPIAQQFTQILTHPNFPEKAFALAQDNVIKRLEFNQEQPQYLSMRMLQHYLYQKYPWEITDQEIIAQYKACTRSNLEQFHQTYFDPSNMVLILVGNIDGTTIKDSLEASFGRWKNNNPDKQHIENLVIEIPDIINPAPEKLSALLPQEQITLIAGRLTTYKDTDDRMALRLLDQCLHRRLFEIREQTGIFYGVQSVLSQAHDTIKGIAFIKCLISVNNIEPAEQAFKNVLQEMCDHGITETDLATAKQNYLAMLAKSFSTNAILADSYQEIVTSKKDWDYFDKKLEKCDTLTLSEVNAVAQKYLNPAEWTFVKIGRIS